MVTTEERIQVLKMVQEGKISAEEAAQLLEQRTPHDKDHFIGHMERSVAGIGAGFNAESGASKRR